MEEAKITTIIKNNDISETRVRQMTSGWYTKIGFLRAQCLNVMWCPIARQQLAAVNDWPRILK